MIACQCRECPAATKMDEYTLASDVGTDIFPQELRDKPLSELRFCELYLLVRQESDDCLMSLFDMRHIHDLLGCVIEAKMKSLEVSNDPGIDC